MVRRFVPAALWTALLAAAGIFLAGCGETESDAARIERLRQQGDVAALEREADGPNAPTAAAAVGALGSCGARAVPRVEQALADTRPQVREEAALAYGRIADDKQLARLATMAREDKADTVRAAAVTALGEARAVNQMEALMRAAEDPDRLVRQRASDAMARIMGRRYELYVDGTPDQRHDAVAKLRLAWPDMEATVRNYYKQLRSRQPEAAKH